jgi:diaminopimelate epimerase
MQQHEMTPTDPSRPFVHLTKHQGAGNDFLVLVDLDDAQALDPGAARLLCDRHFGVGADGVIRVLAGTDGADLTMELTNADGGTAEMSGNGMRCLAQAAVRAGLVPSPIFTVATPGGVRTVEFRAAAADAADGLDRPGAGAGGPDWASVDMGAARLGAEQTAPGSAARGRLVDMGNPHLVLVVDDTAGIEVAALGQALQGEFSEGINVEFIAVGPGRDALTLRVWERGVGETLACGTGSAASAAAAHDWGLVGTTVDVHNPGGSLRVELRPDAVVLSGPVVFVADVEVPAGLLSGGGGRPAAPVAAAVAGAGRRR